VARPQLLRGQFRIHAVAAEAPQDRPRNHPIYQPRVVGVYDALAVNMSAAFKKVRGAIGASDPVLTDLIVTRIVELAKDGVYDIEELSSRTLSSLKLAG
jgi:hypothetical protein